MREGRGDNSQRYVASQRPSPSARRGLGQPRQVGEAHMRIILFASFFRSILYRGFRRTLCTVVVSFFFLTQLPVGFNRRPSSRHHSGRKSKSRLGSNLNTRTSGTFWAKIPCIDTRYSFGSATNPSVRGIGRRVYEQTPPL